MLSLVTALAGSLLVVAIAIRYVMRRRSWDLKHPLLWICIGYIFLFPVRAVFVALTGSRVCETALGRSPSVDDIAVALWLSEAGMIVLYGAVRFFERKQYPGATVKKVRHGIAPWILAAMYSIGQAMRLGIVYLQSGSVSAYLQSNKDELMRSSSGLTLLAIVQSGLVLIPLLIAIRRSVSRNASVIVSLGVAIELIVAGVSGSRFGFASLLLMVAVAAYSRESATKTRTIQFSKWIGITAALTSIAFVPLSAVRFGGIRGLAEIEDSVAGRTFAERYIEPVMERVAGLDSLIIVVAKCPSVYPYTYFIEESRIIVAAPIPRAFWPNKPTISFGKIFSDKMLGGYYAEDVSAAATLWGHGYMIGSIPGIIFSAVLLGILVGACTRAYERGGDYGALASAFVPMFLVVIESDVVSILTSLLATVTIYFGVIWIGSMFKPTLTPKDEVQRKVALRGMRRSSVRRLRSMRELPRPLDS
jgi:hypothetical protein